MRHELCKDETRFSSALTSSCLSGFGYEAPGPCSQGSCPLASSLDTSLEGEEKGQGPLSSPGLHGRAMWKRHGGTPWAPKPLNASPHPHIFPCSGAKGTGAHAPCSLVPGLGVMVPSQRQVLVPVLSPFHGHLKISCPVSSSCLIH